MSKGSAFTTDLLKLIFQNIDIANIGDAGGLRGSVTPGNLYVALHSADPGEAGTQATNEISYTGYARIAVARSAAGWTVTGGQVSNAALVTFGLCTAGSATATYWSVGFASSGANKILYRGTITGGLPIAVNGVPEAGIGQLVMNED